MNRSLLSALTAVILMVWGCSSEQDSILVANDSAVMVNESEYAYPAPPPIVVNKSPVESAPAPGWAPTRAVPRTSLTVVAFIGGIKVLLGLIAAIWALIRRSTSDQAFFAKLITAGMASAAAWLSIIMFSADSPIDAILLLPVPQSVIAMLLIVLGSSALFFWAGLFLYRLAGALSGSRPQAVSVGILSFLATLTGHSLVSALITQSNLAGYVVTYILIGGALGLVLAAVSLLLTQDDEINRARKRA